MTSILQEEYHVGLEAFYTTAPGIGGKLRTVPEDFIVTEQFKQIDKDTNGPYTIATITSKNWETNHLIRSLAKQLHISRNRIHFAGTKDKRSISTQRFSFYNIPKEKIQKIQLKDVTITDIYYSNKKLYIGDLQGNHFNIFIRDISPTITQNNITKILNPIEKIQGFPNFFGIQRFGIIRPMTHIVGKYIVQEKFKEAVMTYLTYLDTHEDTKAYQARETLKKTLDFKNAFHEFPQNLTYEKAMLNYLQTNPTDFIGAIKELPKNLITLFVNAYQSYLFNKIISQRIKKNLPIHQAIIGDIIMEKQQDQITSNYFTVHQLNIDKVNRQITKGKAVVSSVLIGYETSFSTGEMGEIEQAIFQQESIDKRDFIIPQLPLASSSGTRRSIITDISNLSFKLHKDKKLSHTQDLQMQFDLPKGCYATTFLREVMKAKDIRNY